MEAVVKDHTLLLRPSGGDPFAQLSLDAEGRWLRHQTAGTYAKRGLDSRVLVKERLGSRWRPRLLGAQERRELHGWIHGWLASAAAAGSSAGLPPSARRWLERAAAWTPDRLEAEAGRHAQVYGRIPILPPDLYNAIVVQATLGCTYNRCSFCTFYHGVPFRPLAPAEVERQIDGLEALYGRDLERHLKLFLGDANALVLSPARLEALWEVLERRFAIDPAAAFGQPRRDTRGRLRVEGVYTFMDAFNTRRKDPATLKRLASRGLRRVYIGMESGSDRVLRFLEKPGTARDVVDAVRSFREAGIGVGVILLAGAGGRELQEDHVVQSAERVNEMDLGPRDAVFFSPLVAGQGGAWERKARSEGVTPLSAEAIEVEIGAIRRRFCFASGAAPRITRYDLREFIH
ncbi:amino acid ABC transporter substrate-binding protein [Limnochorda pilosa]|uniref:Amino acid ABC transporter substrate-binding protein n=1 Tax=Limnochorda pilosa TaxID=1555112 RepID=A0A0K2SP01_LIMPI|nr:amino acid ABC transporter substrate-binding protein [Limnochorda pilosa]